MTVHHWYDFSSTTLFPAHSHFMKEYRMKKKDPMSKVLCQMPGLQGCVHGAWRVQATSVLCECGSGLLCHCIGTTWALLSH